MNDKELCKKCIYYDDFCCQNNKAICVNNSEYRDAEKLIQVAENELQILIKGIFSRIKEKYGYTDEQVLIYLKGYEDCAEEHQQSHEKRDNMLRDTVAELCEAKRLLKAAVEDISTMPCNNDTHSPDSCYICVKHGNCSYTDSFKWCKADIALKLIGEDGDTECQ